MPDSEIPVAADIIIVGGGPAGASLALLLAAQHRDWRILLLARRAGAANGQFSGGQSSRGQSPVDQRATALSVSSQRIFAAVGLWSDIAVQAAPITDIQVSERGWFGTAQLKAREDHLPAYGYVVENQRLMNVLGRAVGGQPNIATAEFDTVEVAAHTTGGIGLKVDGHPITSQLLVVADGTQSNLRGQLGIGVDIKDYGKTAVAAVVSLNEPQRGIAYERFTAEGPIALLPLPDCDTAHRAALVWTVAPARAEQLLGLSAHEFLVQLQIAFGIMAGKFCGVATRQCFPLRLTVAAEQVRRHLVLIGNAGHNLHPVAGQGFNLTLRDCAALSETLADGSRRGTGVGDLELLESYVRQQHWDQRRTIFLSDQLPFLFGSSATGLALARNVGLVGLDLCPPLRRKVARLGAGIEGREANLNGR